MIRKTRQYFLDKIRIDKAVNKKTAYKVQVYNNAKIDEFVKSYNSDAPTVKPSPSMLWAELSVLNKPEVFRNYNRIINSKYTSNEAFDKILVKNKANKELNRIVEAEVERITKNLNYVEQVMNKYEVPMKMYDDLKAKQANKAIGNRQQILKDVAVKANDLLVSDGLNIPSNVFTYKNLDATAENLLRQSQMQSKHEEINAINDNYISDGKDPIYNSKEWIWTGSGKTTRHASNDHQIRKVNEPFIITNDETLEIDELMYPSDPDGSPGNTFICYCECEYLTEEVDDPDILQLDTSLLNTDYQPPEIDPALKSVTFANASEILEAFKPKAEAEAVEPIGEPIDTSDLYLSKSKNMYLFDEAINGEDFNFEFNEETGKWSVNGLEVDLNAKTFDGGYIKPEKVEEHNNQFKTETSEVKNKPLDINSLEPGLIDGEYKLPEKIEGIKTVGLEYNSQGEAVPVATEEAILEYNKKIAESGDTLTVDLEQIDADYEKTKAEYDHPAEYIDTTDLHKSMALEKYYVGEYDGLEYNAALDKYFFKGLEVKEVTNGVGKIPFEDVAEHNKQFGEIADIKETVKTDTEINEDILEEVEQTETTGEYIDPNKLPSFDENYYDIDPDIHPELEKDIKFNNVTGEWEYKGITLENYAENKYTLLDKDLVIEHNLQFTDDPIISDIHNDETKIETSTNKILEIPKTGDKPIDTSEFEDFQEFYMFENGKELGVKLNEKTGKYELNGIELDTYYPDMGDGKGAIHRYQVDKYNEQFNPPHLIEKDYTSDRWVEVENGKNYVRDCRTLTVEDYSNGERYAVDENGRKWLIDNTGATPSSHGRAELYQHSIQSKIDMSEEYRGVNEFGIGGYSRINHLVLNQSEFGGDKYLNIWKEAEPILNKIRKNTFEGKSIESAEKDLNKLIDKLESNREYRAAETIEDINKIDKAQAKAPPMQQDTLIVRFTPWDESFNEVGKICRWDAPQSCSYQEGGKTGFNASYKYKVTIKVPAGHKGVAISEQFDGITNEREWTSPRLQDFKVLEYDEVEQTATVEFTNNIVGVDL